MPAHGHRKVTVRPPYGDLVVWLGCYGIAVSEKNVNVKLKKGRKACRKLDVTMALFKERQGLWWPSGELKNREVAVRLA